jgi:hypothetical protein
MKKYDLIKIHHWLLVSTFKSKWFEENVKLQIISLLRWIIYPETRKHYSLFSILKGNKILITIISVFFIWNITFFTFGRLSAFENREDSVKTNQPIVIYRVNPSLDSLNFRRKYLEFIIFQKYRIKYKENLEKLSDEVFFAIIFELEKYKIPPSIFYRLLDHESHFLWVYNKSTRAEGFAQILPSTKRILINKIGSTSDPQIDNIRLGAYHIWMKYDSYKKMGFTDNESWYRSLKDYNGGSSSLAKYNMDFFSEDF